MKERIKLPEKICALIERLAEHGYYGYAVGGCVRDMLMGKVPHDFDVTTDAFPSETCECFPDCEIILTGLKHGTVTVVYEGENIEITTFRTDGKYVDNRHPENVTFVRNIADDLSRRDFTVNAMAYNPKKGLIDLFEGEKDIERKIIRCVGDADERFNEDGLRILRAMRFASVLGFEIEEGTAKAVLENKGLLKNISAERIYSEFTKLLLGDGAVKIIKEFYPVISEIFGEIPRENIDALEYCPKDHRVRYAALLAGKGGAQAEKIIKSLKTDNETNRVVKKLVSSIDSKLLNSLGKNTIKETSYLLNEHSFGDLRSIISLVYAFDCVRGQSHENTDKISETVDMLEREGACVSVKQLDITGKDLADIGVPRSKEMGNMLNRLLCEVIDGKIENTHDALMLEAKRMLEKKMP